MHYERGLVIGRFQPFHNGHLYLMQKALESCLEIVIGIGSSNIEDHNNPFSAQIRRKMIELFIKDKNLQRRVSSIVEIPDHPSDDEWLDITRERVGNFDVSFGDNDWVNTIFESAGVPVVRIGYHNRIELEGWKIRELMRDGKEWRDRVPPYIAALIDSL